MPNALLDRHVRETFYRDEPAAPATRLTVVKSFTGRPGAYVVTEIPATGGLLGVIYPQWYVNPKGVCNRCGIGCEHAQAVKRYLEDR